MLGFTLHAPHQWCHNPSCPLSMCITGNHSPGGELKGTMPFRIGKTERDRARGHAQKKATR